MSIHGGFETRRLHIVGALTSVYEAHDPKAPAGKVAVKVLHPQPSGQLRRWLLIEAWLLAAERQQEAAGKGRAALSVIAFGRCPEGAYIVYPWREASLEPLVEALRPTGDRVRELAKVLLAGLGEWETAFGGPHGKLKSSNIFLDGSGVLATRWARFSDPAANFGVSVAELRRRDLASIGAMLVRVIRGRAAGGWPIEPAPEWHALGRAGGPLRDYCNYLLNPRPDEGTHSLEEARRRLELIPADAKPVRTAVRSTLGLSVAAAAGVVALARFGTFESMPPRLVPLAEALGNPRVFREEVAEEWAQLCRDWNVWVADLLRYAERWERTDALWTVDDPLRAALVAFRSGGAPVDPRVVVPEAAGYSMGVLADAPPEPVRQQLLRSSVDRRLQDAWKRVNGLADQLRQWPRWQHVVQTGDQLGARGFPRAAAILQQSHPSKAPVGSGTIPEYVQALNRLSQDEEGVLLLLPKWAEIEAVAAELTGSGDRVQAALPRLTLAHITDRASLGDFAQTLDTPLSTLRGYRQRFLDPAIARDRFLREATVVTGKEEVTEQDVATWEEALVSFRRVAPSEDPRRPESWDETLRRLAESARDLEATAPPGDGPVPPIARGEFDTLLAGSTAELAALRSREILRRDLAAIEGDLGRLREELELLERRTDTTLALLKPEIWLQRIANVRWAQPASQARWDAWRTRELGGLDVAVFEQDRPRFREVRQREQSVRIWLEEFEGSGGLGELMMPPLGSLRPELSRALTTWESRRRVDLATRILDLTWGKDMPDGPWKEVVASPAVRALLETHRSWMERLPELAADLERLGGFLAGGFGWSEGVAEAFRPLRGRTDLTGLPDAPAEWLAESGRLELLAESNDRAALVAAARTPGLSVQLTAWRRLGAQPDWPSGVGDLEIDGALVADIRAGLERIVGAGARRERLHQELAQETRRRWNRAARRAASNEAELTSVFARMDRFAIAESDLEDDIGFNLRLWQIKEASGNEGDIDFWRARRDQFVASARRQSAVAEHPQVAALIRSLEALPLREDPSRSASRSPAKAGWRESLADGGRRVRVTWTGGERQVSLEFELVQPSDGTAPFYLARKEIAVGEFITLLTLRPEGPALFEAMPRWVQREGDGNEPWTAPLTWRPRADRRGIELNPSWIYRPDAQVAPLIDPNRIGATVPALEPLARERPNERSPVQRVSPDLARRFVEEILGARLLTPREWRALVEGLRVGEGVNLRDQRFSTLWSYLETYRTADQTIGWRPNQDIFLPLLPIQEGGRMRRMPLRDNGQAVTATSDSHLWPSPVDDGPDIGGFIHLFGNVWTYLYDPEERGYYVAGGSALSPPALDPLQPQKVEGIPLIGNSRGRALVDGFSDVGIRPAFDAPPGLRDRLEMFRLVRAQQFITL